MSHSILYSIMLIFALVFTFLRISFCGSILHIHSPKPLLSAILVRRPLKHNFFIEPITTTKAAKRNYSETLNGNLEELFFKTDIVVESIQFRTALRDPKLLWEDGVIPYKLSKRFGADEQHRFSDVIMEFGERTCVFFVPHTDEDKYLSIQPGRGCSTLIGRNPDERRTTARLARECFFVKPGILLHEMMHVLGFVHEHNRPDRDKYVRVLEENIIEEKLLQFEKYSWNEVKAFNFSYDYDSIMHYGPYVFSKNGRPTIMPLKEGIRIGQREKFSPTDVLKINKLYC